MCCSVNGNNITLTTTQVQEAIQQSKNNNSQGSDKLNIGHLKYRNYTSSQRQIKTGLSQGGVLSPTLYNIYTADIPPPRTPVQVMAYADDITITSTHISTSEAKKYIQPYLHKVFAKTKQNNLTLNTEKLHSVHSTPCRIKEPSGPQNKQHCTTTHGYAPKGSGPYLKPKTHIQPAHSQHIYTSTQFTTNDKNTHSNRMG